MEYIPIQYNHCMVDTGAQYEHTLLNKYQRIWKKPEFGKYTARQHYIELIDQNPRPQYVNILKKNDSS